MGVSDEMEERTPQMEMADQELEKIPSQGGAWGMVVAGFAGTWAFLGLSYGWLQWCLGL